MVKLKKSKTSENNKKEGIVKNDKNLKKYIKRNKRRKDGERRKKAKKLFLISPFHFLKENKFYYEIKKISFFFRYAKDLNDFKPNINEIELLKDKIKEIRSANYNVNNNFIAVTPYFYSMITSLKKTPFTYDEKDKIINSIMDNYNMNHTISLTKLKELYNERTGDTISSTSLNRRIKNNLNFSYKKIALKPKQLDNRYYKLMSFLFIKIIIRIIKLDLNPIFIDESKFTLKNQNFKTWVNQNDLYHYGNKGNEKRNIILAVGIEKLFHYEITDSNTNKIIFKRFMNKLIDEIIDVKNYVFIMDNLSVHLTDEIKNLVNRYNLKIVYTVPYESSYNPIELSFRFIKNKIYRHIYSNMNDLKNDVENIIESFEFQRSLKFNWAETLEKYLIFINNNINENLNNAN